MDKGNIKIAKRIWKRYNRNNFIRNVFNYGLNRLRLSKFARHPKYQINNLNLEQAQQKIKKYILSGKPALIARFGSNEARCTAEAIGIMLGAKKEFREKTSMLISNNAGVFPNDKKFLLSYSKISMESAKHVDLLGQWDSYMQDYLIKEVCPKNMCTTKLGWLEPYYSKNPWTSALKDKKVLVVHPFKDTIEKQYKKRHLLFENKDMLPEFDLTVIKSVQTIAGEKDDRFSNWEQALNYTFEQVKKIDFDVAIIGCGAYGMPLGSKIKQMGKIAIHLGGATQLLFGIKGARWDKHNFISKLFNEHWVRPSEDEKPKSANSIENSCYW